MRLALEGEYSRIFDPLGYGSNCSTAFGNQDRSRIFLFCILKDGMLAPQRCGCRGKRHQSGSLHQVGRPMLAQKRF
jgi:hypothetical protein